MAFCSTCGAQVLDAATFCQNCGARVVPVASAPPPPPPPAYAAAPSMSPPPASAPHADLGRPIDSGIAILALILNIIIWPGLGSLIAGENVGWTQGFLMLLGVILIFTIIGIIIAIPLMIAMWVWGIMTGVQLINRANAQAAARAQRPV